MAYTINLTNGTTLVPGGLSDGTIDNTHSSLTLIGRDYAGYGQFLNENFVYLLENFANTSGPANPLKGQLWWDTTNNILRVWSGSSWKISTGATSAPYSSPPTDLSALGGDLWFDTTNQQLKVYSGTTWITVGPAATTATGNSGAVPALVTDTSAGTHVVVEILINGTVYAIFSKDTFSSALAGFATIRAGLNFSTIASPTWGLSIQDVNATPNTLVQRDGSAGITVGPVTATTVTAGTITASTLNSTTFSGNLVGNVTATNVTTSTINTQGINATSGYTGTILTASQPNITSVGNLTVLNVSGTGGTTNIYGLAKYNGVEIATVGGVASFTSINNTPIGNATPSTGAFTTLTVNSSLTPTANSVINLGSTSLAWNGVYSSNVYANYGILNNIITNNLSLSGTANFTNISLSGNIVPTANTTSNIGSTTNWFNNIYGTAVHAQYADLAERYASDSNYPTGTVVELGGAAEITAVTAELSDNVFGVISTSAAYLMNSTAGDDLTHPAVALSGRVPVRVTGAIAKGDRLVSAGNGLARSAQASEITPFNVIGRSLVDKTDAGEGIIEAIVRINV